MVMIMMITMMMVMMMIDDGCVFICFSVFTLPQILCYYIVSAPAW
jgi:hypothetical protein